MHLPVAHQAVMLLQVKPWAHQIVREVKVTQRNRLVIGERAIPNERLRDVPLEVMCRAIAAQGNNGLCESACAELGGRRAADGCVRPIPVRSQSDPSPIPVRSQSDLRSTRRLT
jgi:hypothetical protein